MCNKHIIVLDLSFNTSSAVCQIQNLLFKAQRMRFYAKFITPVISILPNIEIFFSIKPIEIR